MPMNSVEQKTAKRLLGIENETVKKSINVCASGERQTVKNHGNTLVTGATEKLLLVHQKKWPLYGLLNLQKLNAIKIGADKKCLKPMAALSALVAAKLKDFFCQLTTFITTARKCVEPSCIPATELGFTCGCVKMVFLTDSKSYV